MLKPEPSSSGEVPYWSRVEVPCIAERGVVDARGTVRCRLGGRHGTDQGHEAGSTSTVLVMSSHETGSARSFYPRQSLQCRNAFKPDTEVLIGALIRSNNIDYDLSHIRYVASSMTGAMGTIWAGFVDMDVQSV